MPKTENQEFSKGKQYCLTLFKIRERSADELKKRLRQKKFSPEIIKQLIAYFRDIQFLDDVRFARRWIEWRINNGYGRHRIALELKEKGVAEDIIIKELNTALLNYNEEEQATNLAQKRLGRYRRLDPAVLAHRLYGYLVRKGFSQNIVLKIIRRYDNKRDS